MTSTLPRERVAAMTVKRRKDDTATIAAAVHIAMLAGEKN
jgi:hypothetical protein